MKQTSTGLNLRALLLTSVSSVVLLSGCETYQNIKSNFFNIRPPQQVEGERRMPMLNTRYAGYGDPSAPQAPAASPQAMRAPAAQAASTAPAATASAPTPYDLYHGQGNDVKPPQVVPAVAAPAPIAPPAAPPAASQSAQQPEEGGFFSRMFSGSSSDSQKPAVRKQFPGNPVHSKHTEEAAPVPQGPLEPPVDGAVPLGEAADVKLTPSAVPDPSAPLLDKRSSVQPPTVKPASDAPWWQRPASSEQKASAVIEPKIEPKEEPPVPVVQQAQPAPEALEAAAQEASAPVTGAKPLVMADEPEKIQPAPSNRQPDPQEAQQADVIPFDYQPQEPGEEITVSKLSDKKNKPQPNWFERNFGGSSKKTEPAKPSSDMQIVTTAPVVYESKPASEANELTTKADTKQERVLAAATPEQAPSKRTWFERVLGFKDDPTPEQKAPYPNVASVPQTPDTFDAIKGAKPLDMEELETERDQAVVSKMELNSEPSGQAVAPMVESQTAGPVASTPTTPSGNDAQLLGHVSDPPKIEKPEDAKNTDDKQLNTKPADSDKEEEQPTKPSSSLEPVMQQPSVAAVPPAAEPVVLKSETNAPKIAQANTAQAVAEAPKEEKSFLSSIAWPWQGKNEAAKQPESKLAEPVAVTPEPAVASDTPVKSGLNALSWEDEPQPEVVAAKDPVAPLVPPPAVKPAVKKAEAPAEMVVPAQTPSPAWVATSAGGTPPAAAIAPSTPDFATSEPEKALPPLAAEAPKAQAKEEEQQAENASATAGALPSPQLLQKVKPLPPSRYETRRKQQAQ